MAEFILETNNSSNYPSKTYKSSAIRLDINPLFRQIIDQNSSNQLKTNFGP